MSSNLFPSQLEQDIYAHTGVHCKVRLLSQQNEHVWPTQRILGGGGLITFAYSTAVADKNEALRRVHQPLMQDPHFLSTPGDVGMALLRTLFLSERGNGLLQEHDLIRVEVNQTPLFALKKERASEEGEKVDAALFINAEIQAEPVQPPTPVFSPYAARPYYEHELQSRALLCGVGASLVAAVAFYFFKVRAY